MTFAVLAAVVGLATVLFTLYRDSEVLPEPAPRLPDWDPLPAPADVARVEFPLAMPGYEPSAVDATVERLMDAYADLLAEAPPEVRARAHRRAALRTGGDPERLPLHLAGGPRSTPTVTGAAVEDPLEDLRATAALAVIERAAGHGDEPDSEIADVAAVRRGEGA